MEHSQVREQVRKMHQELGILLSQMEAAEVPSKEADPLEGKQVEGFNGGENIGLNYGGHHLWYVSGSSNWGIASATCTPAPHHLTRVTERTVGRFYLCEGQDGSHPNNFGLYLGGKYVKWSIMDNRHPILINDNVQRLTMYEVTPTL